MTSRAYSLGLVVMVAVVLAVVSNIPVAGASLGTTFFNALRIAKPRAATAPTVGSNARTLQTVLAGMVGDSVVVTRDEAELPRTTIGFRPLLLAARKDSASVTGIGEHGVTARVNRSLLTTLLTQAGRRPAQALPASLDGTTLAIDTPRGARVQYGNCPASQANTIQSQINGPPPPTTDNASCVILTEVPLATSAVPAALDTATLVDIALELTGMSPNQTREFHRIFGWGAVATLSPPRFIRSYDVVSVGGVPGVLMSGGGRRGPSYSLTWVRSGLVCTLIGYGNPAEAVALASSAS